MFASSLPVITPRGAHALWYTPINSYSISSGSDSQSQDTPNSLSQNAHPYQSLHGSRRGNYRNNYLMQLQMDEEFIAQRKLNIQTFGAAWIRPPGVAKTYQVMMDEQAEREETDAQAAREAQMMQGVEEAEFDPAEEEGAEQDLDDQIPDAEELAGDDEVGEEDLAEEDEGMDEHDLDDDVPEAGSYQHTDTEQSDDDDQDEDEDDTQDLDLSIDAGTIPQEIVHRSSIVRSDDSPVVMEASAGIPRIDAVQRRRRGSDRMDVDRREN
ncbi:hypothetical protein FGG08_005032 [Glutinoglossum americanum]|uniref:Apc15p protein-domain-containing protein n=1 Tax=Glutinoglossum americanum TaxID=1670608 RepID=A0A9P8HVB1_9PEZI|nr:hypothetical protein FGG08_005032 [Glutinoglossum americanum]